MIQEYIQAMQDKANEKALVTAEFVLNGIKDTIERAKCNGDNYSSELKGYELLGKSLTLFADKQKVDVDVKHSITDFLDELDDE